MRPCWSWNWRASTGLRTAVSEVAAEIDQNGVPALRGLSDIADENAGAVVRNYEEQRTWRDRLSEVKEQFMASAAPFGDYLAAVGGLTTGAAAVAPHLGTMTTKLGLVKGAQAALNLVMSMNPIGLLVVAIGAAVAAYVYWRDEINDFLKQGWNLFIGAVEAGMDVLRPVASFLGIDMPDNLERYKFKIGEAETDTGTFEDAVSDASTAAQAMATDALGPDEGPGLVGRLAATETATEDAAQSVEDFTADLWKEIQAQERAAAATEAQTVKMIDYLTQAGLLNTSVAVTTTELDLMAAEFGIAEVKVGDLIEDLLEMPPAAQAAAAEAAPAGKAWADGFFGHIIASFQGGGTFMGGVKAAMTEGFAGLFQEGGALRPVADAWGSALEAIGGIPVVGPFLKAFGPAMVSGVVAIGKKAWGALKGIFGGGGTNDVEDAYQGIVDASTAAAETDAEMQTRISEATAQGHDIRAASVLAMFRRVSDAAGRTIAESDALFERFHHASSDSASEAEQAWALAMAEKIQGEYAALEVTEASADAAAEVWAESYTAQTVTSTEATDAAIANSERLRDALVADARAITAAINAIPDRVVSITYQAIGSPESPLGAGAGGGNVTLNPTIRVEVGRNDVTRVNMEDGPRQSRRIVGHE